MPTPRILHPNRRTNWWVIALAASVVSCSDSGTDPEPGDTDEFVKNYIEALFLGTGPLIPQDNFTACVTNRGQWAGFPRGTAVRVVASTTLDLGSDGVDTKQLIEAAGDGHRGHAGRDSNLVHDYE